MAPVKPHRGSRYIFSSIHLSALIPARQTSPRAKAMYEVRADVSSELALQSTEASV